MTNQGSETKDMHLTSTAATCTFSGGGGGGGDDALLTGLQTGLTGGSPLQHRTPEAIPCNYHLLIRKVFSL